jgi:hypothetical protein
LLPAGAFAGWDLHPLESAAFSRRTQRAVVRQRRSERVKSTQSVYAFIATSVRFFAFIFLMTLRTWTFTVLKHMFIS